MGRARGRDSVRRQPEDKRGLKNRPRQVYVFTEGEVTEVEYIELVHKSGKPKDAGEKVEIHFNNANAPSKLRKPLPMVEEAVRVLRRVERDATAARLFDDKGNRLWNWPQVWVLFDRDEHVGIENAMRIAEKEGVGVAYSHPCFELWRLLHYQNYTSSFGGVCGHVSKLLRQHRDFSQTYPAKRQPVSEADAKHVEDAQVLTPRQDDARSDPIRRYTTAKRHAERINKGRTTDNPNNWDPYTNVWEFVENGLLISGY